MATNNSINKNFKNKGKDIKYLNKDFQSFRTNLIEYAKAYFPKAYSDFNETSPGMMFIEMASYIGDVLSYYVDDTFKESLLPYAEDERSVIALAQFLGYKPKVTSPASTKLSVYQLVPAKGSGTNIEPDGRYFLRIKEGMAVESQSNSVQFRTLSVVDFSDEMDREITVFSRDSNTGEPTQYLIKKYVDAISSNLKETTITFSNSYEPFRSINLPDVDVIQILDVRDSNGNKYYEVPYLGQELIYTDIANTFSNDPDLYQFKSTVPYIIKTLKTPRRFVHKINVDKTTTIQFGAGDPSANDELIIPNFKNVGLGLPNSINKLSESYDPTNFLKTKTYGTSPTGEVTVKYYTGGGVSANAPQGVITRIVGIEFEDDILSFNPAELGLYSATKNSVAVDNEIPATGGRGAETIEEIRQNALAYFGAQNRAVTAKDYQVRTLSMPAKYGGISKVYATSDGSLDNNSPASILASPNSLQEFTDLVMSFITRTDSDEPTSDTVRDEIKTFLLGKTNNVNELNNPFAVNLYVLGYDINGNLVPVNRAVKENLKTYLNEYRILTDGINILDGFIVNIGIEFEIIVLENYNKSEVVTNCINELRDYFSIDNWTFNQTINISEVELLIANVEGVLSVPMVKFVNKCNGQYSPNSYNIEAATKNKIIYPSLDPCVFEIKFPNSDIKGRAR
jgi:hypothetical protein